MLMWGAQQGAVTGKVKGRCMVCDEVLEVTLGSQRMVSRELPRLKQEQAAFYQLWSRRTERGAIIHTQRDLHRDKEWDTHLKPLLL